MHLIYFSWTNLIKYKMYRNNYFFTKKLYIILINIIYYGV